MQTTHPPFYKSLNAQLLVALTLIALISVGGLGVAAYLSERAALETQVSAQLTSVSDLKKEQIITWLEERQADARLLAVNKLNQDHLTQILSPKVPPAHKAELASFLTDNLIGLQQSRVGYSEIAFADTNGIVIIATDPALVGQPTAHQVVFAETLAAPERSFIEDIHVDPNTGLTTMSFGHIVYAVDLKSGETLNEIIGVAYIIVNIDETIYPLIQAWPGMGATGETLLIRAEGGETLFLNNLRFNEDAALKLRIPADAPAAKPAHFASRGAEGIIRTSDYRGVPVLAAYRHIPGIGWGFVAKEDLTETFAPINALARRLGLVAVGVLLIAGLVSVIISRTLTWPLAQLVEGTRAIAAGDLAIEIDVTRQDEVGILANSFNWMTSQLQHTLEGLKQNVTQLRQTQQALRQSAQALEHQSGLLQAVLDGMGEGVIVADENGKFLLFNPAAQKMTGMDTTVVSLAEWPQKYEAFLADMITPLPADEQPMVRAIRGEAVNQTEIFLRNPTIPDGIFVSANARPLTLKNGEIKGGIVVFRNISERKQTEAALRESEARLRNIYNAANDAIFVIDPQHNHIIETNPKASKLLGYSQEELVGLPVSQIHPNEMDLISELWEQTSQQDVGQSNQLTCLTKEGNTIPAEVSFSWVRIKDRRYVLAMVRDVTQRKQLEQQLRQSQKMEAIGRLAGGIAHDFNNLLTVITGYSQLLLYRHFDENSPFRHDVEQINKAGERAAALTRQLLAFSRKQVLQPRILDLNDIVADVEAMLRRLIGEDVELVTALGAELGQVKADPGQIEQVILNLAVNARDAMPRGGKLTIETANVFVSKSYTRQHMGMESGPYVMLAVSDTGIGMDKATLSHIFEPFFTTKGKDKGTGLGLATVHGIVQQSGGHIWVYSEPGRGSTFKIYLSQIEEQPKAPDVHEIDSKKLQGSETVLLVEDETEVRTLVHKVLRENGYTVLEAGNGDEALQTFKEYQSPIHLVLTDVVMPGRLSGRDLVDHLTRLSPEINVLYMSGYTDGAIIRHGILEPDTAFIQKPFDPDTLVHKVRTVLDT